MAFPTNSSTFGIKPPNTGGIFGSQPTQPSNPSPFSTFGTPSQPSTQQPSLFGAATQTPTQIQLQTQNPPASGGLFGQQASGQPVQQQQQQPSGGLFGGGFFGGGSATPANTSTQPTQGGFGTWGQTPSSSQNQPFQQPSIGTGGGLFGGGGQQPQPQSGGLWGSTVPSNAGQSVTGQPPNALGSSQQSLPAPSFTRTTKFNDLPPQVQKVFENIDAHIQGQIQISRDLKARSLDTEPTKGAELIREVHNDLINVMSTLQADKAITEELRSKVEQSVQDTIVTTRIIDAFRNPQQNGAFLKDHVNFPLEYFTRAADEIRQRLQWYKTTIEQIERRLASAQNQHQHNPQAITSALQAQNSTFIALAGKTAELDNEVQKLKALYRERLKALTGSARDPFNEVDKRSMDGSILKGFGTLGLNT